MESDSFLLNIILKSPKDLKIPQSKVGKILVAKYSCSELLLV